MDLYDARLTEHYQAATKCVLQTKAKSDGDSLQKLKTVGLPLPPEDYLVWKLAEASIASDVGCEFSDHGDGDYGTTRLRHLLLRDGSGEEGEEDCNPYC